MAVTMVNVGPVGMCVLQWRVIMRMGMRLVLWIVRPMLMLVMFIMNVAVAMVQWIVIVIVGMAFG